jgi:hypothetical protein
MAAFMIEAYFDESGTHVGSPVMCVAGYLFTAGQARQLDLEWADALRQAGINSFHMADCAHGVGEFARLSAARRDDLARKLIAIIKKHMTVGIAVSMCEADFERLKPADWKRGGAYTICVTEVLRRISCWANAFPFQGRIAYFFESGHRHAKSTNAALEFMMINPRLFDAARYSSHSFSSKEEVRPLQTADILAWEWYKDRTNRLAGSPRPRRKSLSSLLARPHLQAHLSASDLEDWFKVGLDRWKAGLGYDSPELRRAIKRFNLKTVPPREA